MTFEEWLKEVRKEHDCEIYAVWILEKAWQASRNATIDECAAICDAIGKDWNIFNDIKEAI